jgi:hypothetical protein
MVPVMRMRRATRYAGCAGLGEAGAQDRLPFGVSSRNVCRQPWVGHARRRIRTRRTTCRPSTGRSVTVRRWYPCTRPDRARHIGQTAVACGVRVRTTIRSPSLTTSSMTSGERPETPSAQAGWRPSCGCQRAGRPSATTECEPGSLVVHPLEYQLAWSGGSDRAARFLRFRNGRPMAPIAVNVTVLTAAMPACASPALLWPLARTMQTMAQIAIQATKVGLVNRMMPVPPVWSSGDADFEVSTSYFSFRHEKLFGISCAV